MEIRKEDLVKYHIVNTTFYAFPPSIMDKEEIPETVEEVEAIIEKIKEPTKEEIEAKLKEEKKAKLLEQLAELEE